MEEKELPPLVQIVPEPDLELPQAPSGRPPFRKIEGSLFLPEAVATDVQRQAEAMDENLIHPPHSDEEEHSTHSPEEREHFPSLGGGYRLPSFVMRLTFPKRMRMRITVLIQNLQAYYQTYLNLD